MGWMSSSGRVTKEQKRFFNAVHRWSGRKHDGSDSWKSLQEMVNDTHINSNREYMLALVRKNGQMLSCANEKLPWILSITPFRRMRKFWPWLSSLCHRSKHAFSMQLVNGAA